HSIEVMFRPPAPSTVATTARSAGPPQPPPKHPWLKSVLSWYTEQWKWSIVKGAAFFFGSVALAHLIDAELNAPTEAV
ncbi:hypothetical protein BOX15_Mlig011671g3, partial [Macrostomum lignano]